MRNVDSLPDQVRKFDMGILQKLISVDDWPRVDLYKVRWGWNVDSDIENNWYMRHGSDNHKAEIVASRVLKYGLTPYLDYVNEYLDKWLQWLWWREQNSTNYDTYYLASVCVYDFCSLRDGYPEIHDKCVQLYQKTVNLLQYFQTPKGKLFLPGKRTDPEGWSDRRDQYFRLLTGRDLSLRKSRWNHQNTMELGLIATWAYLQDFNFKPQSVYDIGLQDRIQLFSTDDDPDGFVAVSPVLRNCYNFPTWAVWYYKGKNGSLSWQDSNLTVREAKRLKDQDAYLEEYISREVYERKIPKKTSYFATLY